MSLINMWVGAPTSTTFRVVAKVSGAQARMVVSTNPGDPFAAPIWAGAALPTPEGVVSLTPGGLSPATQYYYAFEVDGVRQPAQGSVRTTPIPGTPASFRFSASSCSGHYGSNPALDGGTTFWPPNSGTTDVSNHRSFADLLSKDPDFFVHMGDLHYRDYNEPDPSLWRQGYDDVLDAPNQAALYRNVPIIYTWDDHDYCGNDSNKNSVGRPTAAQVYRERVPHYPLTDSANIGTWQTWVVGRVRFILTDSRAYQDEMRGVTDYPEHSALGAEQEEWLLQTLLKAEEPLICWANPMPWMANEYQFNWDRFGFQRRRIAKFLVDNGIAERMFMVSGDWHGMGFDDGRNNPFGGFPVYHLSPLDSSPSTGSAGTFSHGMNRARGQYGVITVQDDGDTITVLAEGYRNEDVVLTHSFSVRQAAPEPGEPVTSLVPVTAAHYGADTVATWKTVYNGEVINVIAAHVGALSR